MAQRMADDMDFDCGRILDGSLSLPGAGRAIYELLLDVASGTPSASERNGLGDFEFVPWQLGVRLHAMPGGLHQRGMVPVPRAGSVRSAAERPEHVLAASQVVDSGLAEDQRQCDLYGIKECEVHQPRTHRCIHARIFACAAGQHDVRFAGQCRAGFRHGDYGHAARTGGGCSAHQVRPAAGMRSDDQHVRRRGDRGKLKYRRRIGQRRAGNAEPEELVTGIARHVPGRPKSREHQLSGTGQGVERGAIGMADRSARKRNSD